MNKLNSQNHQVPQYTNKILQFGEGNFLRAYIDFVIHKMNKQSLTNYGIVVANSFSINHVDLKDQDGLYTIIESNETDRSFTLVDCITDHFSIPDEFDKYLATAEDLNINIIISNTTEAGIVYQEDIENKPICFPARLAVWLRHRFDNLKKSQKDAKVFILPCELIENNGSKLQEYVLKYAQDWNFSKECVEWIKSCYFYNTLVDRIVPGFPHNFIDGFQKEWNYEDKYAVLTETFFLFVIQGNTEELDKILPFSKLDLDIIYTENLAFYRNRKVAILNGAHTALVSIALLLKEQVVADSLKHSLLSEFLSNYLYQDVLSVLGSSSETEKYIESIFERFKNPYLEHRWESISLNSLSKFNTRNMHVLFAINDKGAIPYYGLFALASLWYYYSLGEKTDTEYHFFKECMEQSHNTKELVSQLLNNKNLYNFEFPEQWQSILIEYYDDVKLDSYKALEKLLKS